MTEIFAAAIFLFAVVMLAVLGRVAIINSHLASVKLEAVREATTMSTVETQRKLDDLSAAAKEIHELVNSRLSAALTKIDKLELRLQALTGEMPTGEPPARE